MSRIVSLSYLKTRAELAPEPVLPVFRVPDDGEEHPCPCGDGPLFRTWEGDGWLRSLVVVDDEGQIVDGCSECGREVEAGR